MMQRFSWLILLFCLQGCSPSVPLPQGKWHIDGDASISRPLGQALHGHASKAAPNYHITVEENLTVERINPLEIKTLHTAYRLTESVTLTWKPPPKGRNLQEVFTQSTWLDISQNTSIVTTPQVRHAKERLRQQIISDVLAYLS